MWCVVDNDLWGNLMNSTRYIVLFWAVARLRDRWRKYWTTCEVDDSDVSFEAVRGSEGVYVHVTSFLVLLVLDAVAKMYMYM